MSVRSKGGSMAGVRNMGVLLAVLVSLAGCVSLGGRDVPDQLFRLSPEETAPAGDIGDGKAVDAIVVIDPDTDRRLDVDRVPVKTSNSTLAYLKDAIWVERPARQFRHLLAETIRAKNQRLVFEGNDIEAVGRVVLSGRLIDMGYDATTQSAVVRYDAVRRDADGTVHSHRFESVIPGISSKAVAIAPALNTAANDVARQVAAWVG